MSYGEQTNASRLYMCTKNRTFHESLSPNFKSPNVAEWSKRTYVSVCEVKGVRSPEIFTLEGVDVRSPAREGRPFITRPSNRFGDYTVVAVVTKTVFGGIRGCVKTGHG